VPKNLRTDLIGYQDFTNRKGVVNSLSENPIPKNGTRTLILKLKKLLFKLLLTTYNYDSGVFA